MRICPDDAAGVLSDLVAIPTVNPMGRPYAAATPVERPALEYIEGLFRPFGLTTRREACSPMHESLFIHLPGRRQDAHTLLESHVDTVPADDWLATAFQPRVEDGTLYGRGACDDKGPLVAMILAVGETLARGEKPPLSVILMAAGDEEYAQTGIKQFAARAPKLARAVFGEPTSLVPVLQHKGTIRWDIVVAGKSAHSSQPELGRDAIRGAMVVMELLQEQQRLLRERIKSPLVTGGTITVTMIQGGRTRNAIADECVLSVDCRVPPGGDVGRVREEVIAAIAAQADDAESPLGRLGLSVSHRPTQIATPALNTSPDDPFSRTVLESCRRATGRAELSFAGAPYGTDAAWVTELCPAVVLGPGSIDHAHAIDERIAIEEVVRCARIYYEVLMSEPTT